MLLSEKHITKVLIRVCGYADWSVLLLCANLRWKVFSHSGPYRILHECSCIIEFMKVGKIDKNARLAEHFITFLQQAGYFTLIVFWLLYCNCVLAVMWLFVISISSSWCCGLACGLWLRHCRLYCYNVQKKYCAVWLSGSVLDSRPRGRGLEPHQRFCVMSLSKTHLSLLSTCSTHEDLSRQN